MSRLSFVLSIALLASGPAAAVIVEQAKPAPTYEAALARSWEDVHNKVLTMAKDTAFADDKLAWKPHPDARSVMEELRHVTIGLEMTTAEAKGEKFDFDAREKGDAGKPKARASVLEDVRTAIDGYRVCITTARRLLHNPPMEMKLRQVLECAVFCEKKLAGFAAVSRLRPIQHRKAEKQFHHIILSVD